MALILTNTLTKKKETFNSLFPGKVKIYCCGVTVYDLCHLGHARSYIVWDILRRYFLWQNYEVTFVQNFTDIDDKILAKAFKDNSTMSEVSEKNIIEFQHDMNALGILPPDSMPRATQCLEGIKSLINKLVTEGAAYSINGDVYFSVMNYSEYGKLSRRDLSEQQLNADGRLSSKEKSLKRNPLDFALWKGAKKDETSFPSPWGKGRPGWHIECSAMVLQELGETIDIHLGGADLIFPHHENEIAQSETATGKQLARYWLHNGMVNVGGQKMSKSLGNFTTIRSLLKSGVSPMTLRLFVLQAHYRKPLDFTKDSLTAASVGWERLNSALKLGLTNYQRLDWPYDESKQQLIATQKAKSLEKDLSNYHDKFLDALNDDLNTSVALSVLFDLSRPLKTIAMKIERQVQLLIPPKEKKALYSRWVLLTELASVLGLQAEISQKGLEKQLPILNEEQIELAIKERKDAKLSKDFAKADKIRSDLKKKGIELIDKPDGTTGWIKN